MQPQQQGFGQQGFGQQQSYGSPTQGQQFGQSWTSHQLAGPSQYVDQNQLRQVFDSWDKNHNGQIDPKELMKAMHHMGEQVSEQDVTQIMGMFDKDHSGTIDFSEFQQLYTYVNQLKQEFNNADTHKHGSLDFEQVKQALHKHHKALILAGGAATIYTLFKLHDHHKKEKLDWSQFLAMSLHLGNLRSGFEDQQFGQQGQQGQFQSYLSPSGQKHHQNLFQNFANWAETNFLRR